MTRSSAVCIGSLHEDLGELAAKVYAELIEGQRAVWAEDDGRVFVADPQQVDAVPLHWIAGTFGLGQASKDIEDDLRALLRERSKDWILD